MGAERSLDIALEPAIEHAGGTVAALRLREPTGREMREAERTLSDAISVESSSAFEVALIGAVSGLPEDVLNKLKISVMHRARQFVTGFDAQSGGRRESQPESLELSLPEPVVSGGVIYERLSLCEPTVGMRRRAETAARRGDGGQCTAFPDRAGGRGVGPAVRRGRAAAGLGAERRAGLFAGFYPAWPADWERLTAHLALLFHWGPAEAMAVTGSELRWWADQASALTQTGNGGDGDGG